MSEVNGNSIAKQRPKDVGILAMEMYFPKRCVSHEDLEVFDGVSRGKYTIGLGQHYMAFVDDSEDINSFALTAVSSLLKKYDIDPMSIGFIEVGTETMLDQSKSVKTVLMRLFGDNTDIEGIDSKHACYGSTASLFNAINWVESSSWDGRNAIVFAGDIAIYEQGNARPVGGAGACAMLIGPNAPLVIDPVHGTYMADTHDFCKPRMELEYPDVDGPHSVEFYRLALDSSYTRFREKWALFHPLKADLSPRSVPVASLEQVRNDTGPLTAPNIGRDAKANVSMDDFDYCICHSAYGKLVHIGYARLFYNDFISSPAKPIFSSIPSPQGILEMSYQATLSNKHLEKIFVDLSAPTYKDKVEPSMACSNRCGNMYTGSLYGGLASLICSVNPEDLLHKRISMFAFGAGCAASFFTIRVKGSTAQMAKELDVHRRLNAIKVVPCTEFVAALKRREKYHGAADYAPPVNVENLWPGSYYLIRVDDKYRRIYAIA